MILYVAIAVYAVAIICANLTVAAFGPWVSPINAFLLIGLDLALRDWLHFRLRGWKMGALIGATGVLTYALNPAAQQIAIASAVAFAVSSMADWLVFVKMPGTWFQRSTGSNVAGALVDSLIFPTMAFGALLPAIVLMQFAAKVIGGTVWAAGISKFLGRPA